MLKSIFAALIAAQAVSGAVVKRHDEHDCDNTTSGDATANIHPLSTANASAVVVTVTDYTTVIPTSTPKPSKRPTKTVHIAVTDTITETAVLPSASTSWSSYPGPHSPIWYTGPDILPGPPPLSSSRNATSTKHKSSAYKPNPTGDFLWPSAPSASTNHTTAPAASGKPGSFPEQNASASHKSSKTSKPKPKPTTTSAPKKKPTSTSSAAPKASSTHKMSAQSSKPAQKSSKPVKQSSTAVVVVPIDLKPTVTVHLKKRADTYTDEVLAGRDNIYLQPRKESDPTLQVMAAPSSNTAHPTPKPSSKPPHSLFTPKASSTPPPAPKPTPSAGKPPSNKPKPTSPPKPSGSTPSAGGDVKTTVVSQDPRCPYPYPGIRCGKPITTITTETKKASRTGSEAGAEKTGWCPYPYPGGKGQAC